MCSIAVVILVFGLERTCHARKIRCCWSAAARESSPGCFCGKRLFQTRKCWSWWHRLGPLWSVWEGNLVTQRRRWLCAIELDVTIMIHIMSQNVYLQTVHQSRAVPQSCASHRRWRRRPDWILRRERQHEMTHLCLRTKDVVPVM